MQNTQSAANPMPKKSSFAVVQGRSIPSHVREKKVAVESYDIEEWDVTMESEMSGIVADLEIDALNENSKDPLEEPSRDINVDFDNLMYGES